jgi:lysophospholipase L1-like esterase
MKRKLKKVPQNILLGLFGSVLALVLLEFGLRLLIPHNKYYALYPNLNIQTEFIANQYYSGLPLEFQYTSNDEGYRSKHKLEEGRYGILALGGSTTECTYIGEKANWTFLLEEKLNAQLNTEVTIANVGSAGMSSEHHVVQLERLEPQLGHVNAVIILVGINDFIKSLYSPEHFSLDKRTLLAKAFAKYPRSENEKWYQRTELWMHYRDFRVVRAKKRHGAIKSFVTTISKRRNALKNARVSSVGLSLNNALAEYSSNIQSIVDYCRDRNIMPILITQPTLWHHGMSEREFELTALGAYIEGDSTYSASAYEQGMNGFNNVLREFANDSVRVIDLANILPKDTIHLYDHCHFTMEGSYAVSEILLSDLLSTLPIK